MCCRCSADLLHKDHEVFNLLVAPVSVKKLAVVGLTTFVVNCLCFACGETLALLHQLEMQAVLNFFIALCDKQEKNSRNIDQTVSFLVPMKRLVAATVSQVLIIF